MSTVVGTALALAAVLMPSLATSASAATEPAAGDPVWLGSPVGYSGTHLVPVYSPPPADTSNPGTPSYYAYCIEHDVSLKANTGGVVGSASDFLGSNYFETDPTISGKVLWVLAHSYPAVSLVDLAAAAGVASISPNDAIEATQYAIWRYTDLGFDAAWPWASPNSQAAYEYLVNSVNGGATMSPGDVPSVTASVTAPAGAQQAGTLVGPFTVHTNQPSASLTVVPGVAVTDASGNPVNAASVVDGQQVYLDLRNATTAGSATVTVTAQGAGGTGKIISVPTTVGGTPTEASHKQTLILVAGSTATTTGSASVTWTAAPTPSIATTLVGKMGGTHTVDWYLSDLVDTVSYQNLTPGTQYTVTGELMKKSDGSATGITGSKTFTPTQPNGTVNVSFTVPLSLAGQELVAFEKLTVTSSGTVVASHEDINDAAQTVTITKPSIGTTLVDKADGDHTIPVGGGTVVDTVAYQNLAPGIQHTVTGELYRKSDGTATGITATKTFTTSGTGNGTVDVEFTVPAGYAGESLVAFEKVTYAGSNTAIARHEDINDTAQTVTVGKAPVIGTTLTDKADGDHVIPAGGGTLVDTVAYQNLVPGTEYTVTGELRRKSDGTATGITGSKTFTPDTANGTVEVEFAVPAGYAGQKLVAFEELTVTAQEPVVASHKDIDDAAQTVSVDKSVPAVNTQASAATVTMDGASVALHDTVTITGFVAGATPASTGTATLYGPLTSVNDEVCTPANAVGTVSLTPANGTIATPSITVTEAGIYTWQVTLTADDRNQAASHPCGMAEETTKVIKSQVGAGEKSKVDLTTETSHAEVEPGAQVSDEVTITGFVPGHGATGSATLYGPFASRSKITCTPAHAVATVAFTPANGTVETPKVEVNRTGYYSWVASTTADSHNTAATHACGLVSETTVVRKDQYAVPVVSTGFSNDGWDGAARRTVQKVSIPSIGVNARSSLVGIKRGTMQVPGNVARTGQLTQSAAAGDLIGTTVIAGHVSDRHDRPGAFWKLTKIRKGKVVTLWQNGKKLKYRVTGVERFSRTQKLPERFFSTTGEHKLVLISCAGKVTTPGGGFHYRQNVVVTAVPIG